MSGNNGSNVEANKKYDNEEKEDVPMREELKISNKQISDKN